MVRIAVLLCMLLAAPVAAEEARLPELSGPRAALEARVCENVPYLQANCVRVLACVGSDGLWFDGEARGWDTGGIRGVTSEGTAYTGTWDSRGFGGVGIGELTCQDGMTADVVYTSQDPETGTVIGAGRTDDGRQVKV